MQWKNINSFIRGIFNAEGKEHRVDDQFNIRLHNLDVDFTGRVIRRRGYDYWSDLQNSASRTSQLSIPDTSQNNGFKTKIQQIYPFINGSGNESIFSVANGKIYMETYENLQKVWIPKMLPK